MKIMARALGSYREKSIGFIGMAMILQKELNGNKVFEISCSLKPIYGQSFCR
jgi:hypothetical protein